MKEYRNWLTCRGRILWINCKKVPSAHGPNPGNSLRVGGRRLRAPKLGGQACENDLVILRCLGLNSLSNAQCVLNTGPLRRAAREIQEPPRANTWGVLTRVRTCSTTRLAPGPDTGIGWLSEYVQNVALSASQKRWFADIVGINFLGH